MAALTKARPDIAKARRLIIKIGSALLVDQESGQLKADWLIGLAEDVAEAKARGTDVVLVSSGSIALGRQVLGLASGELALEQSQAAASVGQIRLARAYEEALGLHGIAAGQVLVTLEDTADRRRYLNSRATLEMLLSLGVVPIVNENDTVATDEIRFGDNDRLAAQVAATIGADQLILLSDVDGLYTANPQLDPTAQRLDVVPEITPEIESMADEGVSALSKGGMKTKILAAKTAVSSGCAMAIAKGAMHRPIRALLQGEDATWFLPSEDPQAARKRWIVAMKTKGQITVDQGAVAALGNGKSLLPAGVQGVAGDFSRGDPVSILGPDGHDLGKGLVRYTADEARLIAGLQSSEISKKLGYAGRAALVHRDDMAL